MLKPFSTTSFHLLKDYTILFAKEPTAEDQMWNPITHDIWVVASTIISYHSVQIYDSVYYTVNAKTIDVINIIIVITDETKLTLKGCKYKRAHKTVDYLPQYYWMV